MTKSFYGITADPISPKLVYGVNVIKGLNLTESFYGVNAGFNLTNSFYGVIVGPDLTKTRFWRNWGPNLTKSFYGINVIVAMGSILPNLLSRLYRS